MEEYLIIDPANTQTPAMHAYLLGAVAPRPIAFASTMDKNGVPNLAPFSYFNVFSTNPPVLIFAPNRSGRTGHNKHTYENAKETGEVVVNLVSYDMVEQTNLASTEYPRGINEFTKAGFTPLPSQHVKPFRVKESPVQVECKVRQLIELGEKGGAGNLIICDILKLYIRSSILDENKKIDPQKIDLVARMGGDWYCRANGDALFQVRKPLDKMGIGVDQLPSDVRLSKILTGNDLGKLGNVEKTPTADEVKTFQEGEGKNLLKNVQTATDYHRLAHELLAKDEVDSAWKVLLLSIR